MRNDIPFRGSTAVAGGWATRRRLAGSDFRRLARGTYVSAEVTDGLATAVLAATQRHRGAVVAGSTAAVLLGAVDPDDETTVDLRGLDPVELTRAGGGSRAGTGVRIRREHLDPAEVVEHTLDGVRILVTSPARTAYDLARTLPTVDAVVVLEAFRQRQEVRADDVRRMADEHPHARGLVRLRAALPLVEDGARRPIETRIRIALVAAGLARPVVGHVVRGEGDTLRGVVDLAWSEERCAVLCDRDPDTAHRLAGGLVLDGWKVVNVERDRWRREPAAVVESIARMLRGRRRTLGLDRRDERRARHGTARPPRPQTVRLYP